MIKPRRRWLVLVPVALAALVACSAAWAHAHVSPPVVLEKESQVYTLAVPTEEEDADTTEIEMTVPSGFSIDSFIPVAGWKRDVVSTGEGEEAVVQKVTWTGGKIPPGEATGFQFLGRTDSAKTYTFQVRQTYSNGKVVDWSGSEDSDTPAVTIESKSSLGSGGSSTLAVIALVLGGIGVVLGAVALFAHRGGRELA